MAINPLSARTRQTGLVPTTRTITTGNGLSNLGDMTQDRTLNLNSMAGALQGTSGSGPGLLAKGAGDTARTRSIASGGGIRVSNGNGVDGNPTVEMRAPGSITRTSINNADDSGHTHELTQTAFRDMLANYHQPSAHGYPVFARYVGSGGTVTYGSIVSGSDLRPSNDGSGNASSGLPGNWVVLGHAFPGTSTMFMRV